MNSLITDRLELIPLNAEYLRLLTENIPTLEIKLNCSYQAEPMEVFFREIVVGQLLITEQDPENYVWHSFWLILRKSDRVIVGLIDFKDVPNNQGEVEIGYGLGESFEYNGYMTESVKEICKWAKEQDGVSHIIAETDIDGYASQRILQRCGFTEYNHGETSWWRY